MRHTSGILLVVTAALLTPTQVFSQKTRPQPAVDYIVYVGSYAGSFHGDSLGCEIYVEGERLIASCNGEPAELLPRGDHQFGVQGVGDASPEQGMMVEFEVLGDKAVAFLIRGDGDEVRLARAGAITGDEAVSTDFTPYVGTYGGSFDDESFTCEVFVRGQMLIGSCQGDEAELLPRGDHRFAVREVGDTATDEGTVVEFEMLSGRATAFVIHGNGEGVRVTRTTPPSEIVK